MLATRKVVSGNPETNRTGVPAVMDRITPYMPRQPPLGVGDDVVSRLSADVTCVSAGAWARLPRVIDSLVENYQCCDHARGTVWNKQHCHLQLFALIAIVISSLSSYFFPPFSGRGLCVPFGDKVLEKVEHNSSSSLSHIHCPSQTLQAVHRHGRPQLRRRHYFQIPEKTRRPAASSGTIPTCENPGVARPGIEPGSPWRQASMSWLMVACRSPTPSRRLRSSARTREILRCHSLGVRRESSATSSLKARTTSLISWVAFSSSSSTSGRLGSVYSLQGTGLRPIGEEDPAGDPAATSGSLFFFGRRRADTSSSMFSATLLDAILSVLSPSYINLLYINLSLPFPLAIQQSTKMDTGWDVQDEVSLSPDLLGHRGAIKNRRGNLFRINTITRLGHRPAPSALPPPPPSLTLLLAAKQFRSASENH
ncbi:hypothetical protein PR048_030200 [Dryococelus australis]|uniref:Uncharacterized protein n=1 Tax=Dryococelus australis TaxID=614101 RepID=A0ABQ9GAX0_9NEOP|nr:hypothetical protein PR048_030200 [Dryococelus australis]